MTTRLSLPLILLAACSDPAPGEDPGDDGGPPGEPDAGDPGDPGAIARCAAERRALTAAWAVNNQHGEVRSMGTDPDGRVVLGSVDRTVKVWQFGFAGASPLEAPGYGTPYEPGAGIATTLAYSADDSWLAGGDDAGEISVWYAAEGELRARVDTGDLAIAAIGFIDSNRALVADDSFAGNLRVWDIDAGTFGPVLETQLWGVTQIVVAGDAVYVAGDDYGTAFVERRSTAELASVTGQWGDVSINSPDTFVAVAGGRVFAAGTGFVAILDENLEDPTVVQVLDLEALAIAATPGGDFFAVLDAAGTVRLHDATGAERSRTPVDPSVGLSFDAAGEVVMVGGSDGWLRSFTCD